MTFQTSAFYALVGFFAPCFTKPSFQNFVAVSIGWVFARDRHTVSGALRAGTSLGATKHFSVFYRFSSRANWVPDALGKILLHRLLPFIPGSTLVVLGDDTLCRKTGPCLGIWDASRCRSFQLRPQDRPTKTRCICVWSQLGHPCSVGSPSVEPHEGSRHPHPVPPVSFQEALPGQRLQEANDSRTGTVQGVAGVERRTRSAPDADH